MPVESDGIGCWVGNAPVTNLASLSARGTVGVGNERMVCAWCGIIGSNGTVVKLVIHGRIGDLIAGAENPSLERLASHGLRSRDPDRLE
ncbi:uncharacterized protein N7459_009741 [Penicillium hispanicum]|uniref:uncharacterized protein n=1 Tax=Penicillium hispanicum TaxID=1080232 RepID=UPI0025420D8A|nr:uncharacterized protein N7459_009741 [Penicillium hispanicum]KAJ5570311.1 hypothetical protein N7459_009741 [Penicillium hispanicum]